MNDLVESKIPHSEQIPLKENYETEANDLKNKEINANEEEKPKSLFQLLKGYLLIIAFSLIVSMNGILLKMSFTLSGADSAAIRYFLQLIVMFIIAKYKKISVFGPPKERRLLTYRGLTGIGGLIFGFFAIKLINPSDLKVINHSNIIFTAILARIFLKEKLTIMHFLTFCLTVIGVLFIAQPKFLFDKHIQFSALNTTANETDTQIAINESSLVADKSLAATLGVTFAILSSCAAGISRVVLKKLCNNKVHFSIATIYAAYYGLPLGLILSLALTLSGITHKEFVEKELKYLPIHLLYTVIASFIGIFAQVLLNLALKYEDATKLGIVKTIDVFFAFILQYFLLNIKVNMFSIFGALSILLGAVLLLLFKIVEAKVKHLIKRNNKTSIDGKLESKFSCLRIIFIKF